MRLNLGGGDVELHGFELVDRSNGREVYPLDAPDNSVEEIYASHVLEHFGHQEAQSVVRDWVRALVPGGRIRIAVPDFEVVARRYLAGAAEPTFGYVYGGQIDGNDRHGTGFDYWRLRAVMRAAGLRHIKRWTSEIEDCASLPVSLNLEGRKAVVADCPKTMGFLSAGRIGFLDHAWSVPRLLLARGIECVRSTGAYWHQCQEREIKKALDADPEIEWIVCLDYDSLIPDEVFDDLCYLFSENSEYAALAPWQCKREGSDILVWITDKATGARRHSITHEELEESEIVEVDTCHFGCTLVRAEYLRQMPQPWFSEVPAPDGGWGEGRVDADIGFWHNLRAIGGKVGIATQLSIAHMQLVATWPDRSLRPTHQYVSEYFRNGPPKTARL